MARAAFTLRTEHLGPLPLVDHFLEHLGVEMSRDVEGISAEAMALLMAHDWPGNVRELRNVLERGLVVTKTPVIQATDLGLVPGASGSSDKPASLSEVEKRHIAAVLHHSGGNVSQAARILDIDRVTLYNKIRKYHLRDVEEHEAVAETEKT